MVDVALLAVVSAAVSVLLCIRITICILALQPTKCMLTLDMKRLAKIMDVDQFASFRYTIEHVKTYYEKTTFRDYKLLEFFTGSNAMHTNLVSPVKLPYVANHLKQLMYVMMSMTRTCGAASNVLEVGFGKGSNSIFLRALNLVGFKFFALDVVPAHVQYATDYAAKIGYQDVQFHLGDAANPPVAITRNMYDMIFGIESFCHLDTAQSVDAFLHFASTNLKSGGKLVIVDGFRADNFETLHVEVQKAMELAESGFRIRRMTSKAVWKKLLAQKGGFVVREDLDLTLEALPFWTKGWRLGHLLLRFAPWLVCRYTKKGGERYETFANLVSVCMTAYAMALGSFTYGVLVIEKV
jgi:SAM-dependent methyltransferase